MTQIPIDDAMKRRFQEALIATAGYALSEEKTAKVLEATLRQVQAPAPPATWADSVAVGFPVNRTDGLIALHVGGSYTLLTKEEAYRLSSDLHAGASAAL